MALDPRLILAADAPNLVGARMQGEAGGRAAYAQGRQMRLDEFLGQRGPDVMRGDAGAMAELSRFDLGAAMGVQGERQQMQARDLGMQGERQQMQARDLGMQATQQDMRLSAERADMLRAEARQQAADRARAMSAAELAQEEAEINRALTGLAPSFSRGNRAEYEATAQRLGLDVQQYPFEQFESIAAMGVGVLDAVKAARELSAGPKPADEYQRYAQEETQAGRQPLGRIGFEQAKKGKGTTLNIGADNSITFSEGGPAFGPGIGQNPTMTATPRDSTSMAKKMSEADAKTLADERARAMGASDLESIANQMEALLPDVGYTGPGGALVGRIDDALTFGTSPRSGPRSGFTALSSEASLASSSKLTGVLTDRDMAIILSTVPGMSATKEGNAMIARIMRVGAERVQARAQFMEAYAARVGSLEGAVGAWKQFMDDNPLLERSSNGIAIKPDADWADYVTPRVGPSLSQDDLRYLEGN